MHLFLKDERINRGYVEVTRSGPRSEPESAHLEGVGDRAAPRDVVRELQRRDLSQRVPLEREEEIEVGVGRLLARGRQLNERADRHEREAGAERAGLRNAKSAALRHVGSDSALA